MTPEQIKRREELSHGRAIQLEKKHGKKWPTYYNAKVSFCKGYDAGFEDSQVSKAVCCMEMEEQNKELTRKLEVATSALKKAIEFGEYAEWAIEADKNLQQLDIDARAALKALNEN